MHFIYTTTFNVGTAPKPSKQLRQIIKEILHDITFIRADFTFVHSVASINVVTVAFSSNLYINLFGLIYYTVQFIALSVKNVSKFGAPR